MFFSTTLSSFKLPAQNHTLLAGVVLILTLLNVLSNVDTSSLSDAHGDTLRSSRSTAIEHPTNWVITGLGPAVMTPEESIHYQLDTPAGAAEWESSLPRGRGIIYLTGSCSNNSTPFRSAIFHQLECLDIIRKEMVTAHHTPPSPSILTSDRALFCLNYLRQSIQCHGDTHLEMVRSEYGGRSVLPYTSRTDCMDWEAVWREAERNYDERGTIA